MKTQLSPHTRHQIAIDGSSVMAAEMFTVSEVIRVYFEQAVLQVTGNLPTELPGLAETGRMVFMLFYSSERLSQQEFHYIRTIYVEILYRILILIG